MLSGGDPTTHCLWGKGGRRCKCRRGSITRWRSPAGETALPSGVSVVLLAAGAGSRFGGGKLLAPFGDGTLIGATLRGLRGAPVDEIIVVLGEDAEELRRVCEPYGVRF